MASDRIDQLRSAEFPTERRGFDRQAVSSYLAELAEWLESGGADQARGQVIQREMGRVGERTGTILAAAQESADKILADASTEAQKLRADAEAEATEARTSADAYAKEAREGADAYAKELREGADAYSTEIRSGADAYSTEAHEAADQQVAQARAEADEHAKLSIREADARAEKILEEATIRNREMEAEIAELVAKREQIKSNLEELTSAVRSVIDGPASADMGLPEHLLAPPSPPRPPGAAGAVGSEEVVVAFEDDDLPADDPDATTVYDVVETGAGTEGLPYPDTESSDEAMPDTDEAELDDRDDEEEEDRPRRAPVRRRDLEDEEQSTEESNLSEFL